MADTALSTPPPAAGGFAARLIGVVTSPRRTYGDVAAQPRWLGVVIVLLAVNIGLLSAFLATDVGREALVDVQIRYIEAIGRSVSDAQYARLERIADYAPALNAAGQLVLVPLALLAVSGVAAGVLGGLLGGDARFVQVVAVVAHSGVILAVQQLFTVPLDYARQTLGSAANLAMFLPMLDESSFPARLLGGIDLFRVWWLVSLAIGLGVLYRRRTAPIAWTLLGIDAARAVVAAIVLTVLSGA